VWPSGWCVESVFMMFKNSPKLPERLSNGCNQKVPLKYQNKIVKFAGFVHILLKTFFISIL
jgi:hypothetical protein